MSEFPYPGLRPFKTEETDIFFGREDHINQLLKKLEGSPHFLAVVGPSGCGKSSLVHTGLLARLGQRDADSVSPNWRIAELHPGSQPLENLAKSLLAESALGAVYRGLFPDHTEALYAVQKTLRQVSLRKVLQNALWCQSDPEVSAIEGWQSVNQTPPANFLLLVDQFEELFRCYQTDRAVEATRFVELLLDCCQLPNVYVVVTMRSDFLGECTLFENLPAAINQGLFLMPRLSREHLRRAIEAPAKVFGGTVESALVEQLLEEADQDSDQLPLLQHALMRMWYLAGEQSPAQMILTLTHYQIIGGKLTTALSRHADETYKALGPAQYKIAESLFRSLTELGNDNRDGRRPVTLSNVAAQTGVPWERVAAIVEMFRQPGRWFLTPGEGVALEPQTVINITHESLIREWQRLKNWAKNEAVSAALYQRVEIDARLWEEGEAELWHGLNLNNALVWRNLERPNKVWANRYGKYFDLAMRFLEASEERQNEEQRQLEVSQQRELQRRSARKQVVGSLLALMVVALLALFEFIQVRYALQARQAAITAEQNQSSNLFEFQLTHAALLAQVGDYAKAKEVLLKSHELDAKVTSFRSHARDVVAWFSKLMGNEAQKVYPGPAAQLTTVALSPDAQLLATGGENGTLVLFDVSTGQRHQLKGHDGHINALVFHPQGNWLASGGDDKRIIFWSLMGEKLFEWQAPDKVYALAVDPAGQYLASGGKDKNITLWELANGGKHSVVLSGHTDSISEGGLAFSPSGKLLASGSYDDTARLWEVETGKTLHTLTGHTKDVENVTFSPDGQWLATSSDDTSVRLWEVATGRTLQILNGHKNRVYGIRFIAEGGYLVSASHDSTLRVWDIHSGVTLRILQGHRGRVTGITTHAHQVFSAGSDGTVRQWEITLPYQRLIELDTPVPKMKTLLSTAALESPELLKAYAVAIAPDGHSIAVGFAEGNLRLYSLPETRVLWEVPQAHNKKISSLAFNNEGNLLASASADQTAKLWQTPTGELRQTLTGHRDQVKAVAFSPDSHLVATAGGEDGQIGLFTVGSEEVQFIPQAHEGKKVSSVTFNQTGTYLLSSGGDNQAIRQWDVTTHPPQQLPNPPRPQKVPWAIVLSPDGQTMASVGSDQLVHIYSLPSGVERLPPLEGHEQTIFRAIFSPDSQQLATVSGDGTIRFWDLAKSNELFTLQLPTQTESTQSYEAKSYERVSPVSDFDFRCTENNCWIAVPLTRGKLALYELGNIYR